MRFRVENMVRYPILPVSAPRQLRNTRFSARDAFRIQRYHAFRDEVRLRRVKLPIPAYVRFEMPVPKSGLDRVGKPHEQKPDKDNLEKALLDALFGEDCHVYSTLCEKLWALQGGIVIGTLLREV